MSLGARVRDRFARPPEPVRASAGDGERVLAWGELLAGGFLVATTRGLRVTGASDLLPWHEVGTAGWAAAGEGGTFTVVPLAEVEPGVQARQPARRYGVRTAGELPRVVRDRVDRTVATSRRHPLPGGGTVLLVARVLPGRPGREWTVVFDDAAARDDPVAREVARERLAAALAAEDPAR